MNQPAQDVSHLKVLFQNLLRLQELEFGDVRDGTVEAAISDLRRKIPLPILEHYDRLTARGKTGMAAVRNQVCTGCHMRVPIGAVIRLMNADDIQMCDNCGRYLYLPADSQAEISAPVAAPPPVTVAPPAPKKPKASKSRPKTKPLAAAV